MGRAYVRLRFHKIHVHSFHKNDDPGAAATEELYKKLTCPDRFLFGKSRIWMIQYLIPPICIISLAVAGFLSLRW
jgi:hypothetical protein